MSEKRTIDKINEKIPNYPGRERWEAAVGAAIAPMVRKHSTTMVVRSLGYLVLWEALDREGVKNPTSEMAKRRWLGRSYAYKLDADFRRAWGMAPGEFRAKMLDESGRLKLRPTDESSPAGGETAEPAPPAG